MTITDFNELLNAGKCVDLVDLGESYVSHKESVIYYIDQHIYAEDYDVPAIPHPELEEISFKEYREKMENLKKKIEISLKLLNVGS